MARTQTPSASLECGDQGSRRVRTLRGALGTGVSESGDVPIVSVSAWHRRRGSDRSPGWGMRL